MTKPCFDIVSTDLYRNAANAVGFRDKLQPYLGHGKPLAITEFGSCTYRGAASKRRHGLGSGRPHGQAAPRCEPG